MLATAAFGRRVSARLSRILPGRPSRWRRLVSGTTRKDRTRGSRTLSVCTTTAGRRLSTRTHHTSPRRGSSSPFVVTVLLGHPSSLMPAPRRFVIHDVPAVAIQVFPGLLTDTLRLEQVCKKLGSRRASASSGLVRDGQQIFWKRYADLHGVHNSITGIPEYSVCSSCKGYRRFLPATTRRQEQRRDHEDTKARKRNVFFFVRILVFSCFRGCICSCNGISRPDSPGVCAGGC